jgi:RNA polymerase sigma-70 factor, ECF subfamily
MFSVENRFVRSGAFMHALKPRLLPILCVTVKLRYSDLTDYELVVASQEKDQGAFTVLHGRYLRHVKATIFRLSPDWISNHDDMEQEVFVRVWRSLSTLKNPWAFKTWLNRLVSNMFYDELRRRPRTPTVSLDRPFNPEDEDDTSSRDIVDARPRPDDSYASKELMERINESMAMLPLQFRKVVALRELDGLSYEEIAVLTRSSLGTVKSRIARGRTKMQSYLQPLIA